MSQSTAQGALTETSVYRYYDANDVLLYVGITKRGIGRNIQHSNRAEWWQWVARQEVEHYPSRERASRREKELIQRYHPPFNKAHNGDWQSHREAYFEFRQTSIPFTNWNEAWEFHGSWLEFTILRRDPDYLVLASDPRATMMAGSVSTVGGQTVRVIDQHNRIRGVVQKFDLTSGHLLLTCQVRRHFDYEGPVWGKLKAKALSRVDKCHLTSVQLHAHEQEAER